jgi:AbrB family looped-hinge helix DNA binding protein
MVAIAHIAHMSERGQITIPDGVLRKMHLEPGQPFEIVVQEGGVLIRPIDIDPEQSWFWTPEWRAREREADRDYAEGRFITYHSTEEFLDSLPDE